MARFEKMDKPKPKGKVGRPKGKGGKSKELSDLSAEVEFIRQRANSRQDSITTDQSIGSGDEHSESAKAKSKRARSFELSGLEDYWTKKESTGMKEESWLLPTERQGHVVQWDYNSGNFLLSFIFFFFFSQGKIERHKSIWPDLNDWNK